ncbi:MAG TPA: hypothetical protein VD846_14125 [Allosphingosinicella sp.]|nr:hypothetical protein [Allosphingosinicella sp.]
MDLLPALAAAALAQASPSATQEPAQVYRCEVLHATSAGTLNGYMLVGDAGESFDAWVRWDQSSPNGAGTFHIRWTLDPKLQLADATVEVDVPLRKWKMGRASLGLRRPDDTGIGNMALMGPILHGRAGGGRGVAQVGLRTLLAYAADADRLRWHAASTGSNKTLGFGDIDMAPLRAAVAALPEVRAELAAKRARPRSECKPHVEEPEI